MAFRPTADGSGHGSDVGFHFQTLAGRRAPPSKEDLALSDVISSYDVNFAKSGEPNGRGLPEWPAFTGRNEQVMVYRDDTASASTYPLLDKMKVLDSYCERLREEK